MDYSKNHHPGTAAFQRQAAWLASAAREEFDNYMANPTWTTTALSAMVNQEMAKYRYALARRLMGVNDKDQNYA